MKDAKGISKVATIIEEYSYEPLVVVVSALGKTTNALENLLKLSLSGKMEELQQIADRMIVLRDGKSIGEVTLMSEITLDQIISRMVGWIHRSTKRLRNGCFQ